MTDDARFEDYFFGVIRGNIDDVGFVALSDFIDPSAKQLEPKCNDYVFDPLKERRFPPETAMSTSDQFAAVSERFQDGSDPISRVGNIKWCIDEFIGIANLESTKNLWGGVYFLSLYTYCDALEPSGEEALSVLVLTEMVIKSGNNFAVDTVIHFYTWLLRHVKKSPDYDVKPLLVASCLLAKISISRMHCLYDEQRDVLANEEISNQHFWSVADSDDDFIGRWFALHREIVNIIGAESEGLDIVVSALK